MRTVSDRYGPDTQPHAQTTQTHTYTVGKVAHSHLLAPQIRHRTQKHSLSIKQQQIRLLSRVIAPSVSRSCSPDSALHATRRSLPGSGQICVRSIIVQPCLKGQTSSQRLPASAGLRPHKTKNIHFDGPQMKALVLTEGYAFGGKLQKYICEAASA